MSDIVKLSKDMVKKCIKTGVLVVYKMLTVLPIHKDIIVFESNIGRNYTGNPRYIYEEMVSQGLDKKYDCYFILENVNTMVPGNAKKVKRMRFQYFYILARAKFIVADSRLPVFFIKRKGATYIQTWHGTPLKKLALDMDDVSMAGESNIDSYKKNFYENAKTWDYLISQNPFSTATFRRCFAFDKEVLEIGYPRNDILMNHNDQEYINELKKRFHLPLDKKIALYAPTWRDNEFYDKGEYKFNPKLDFDLLQKELSDEYVIIVKYHYLVKDNINWDKYKGFVYDFDLGFDIAELYLVSDILITDYSSVMFDYSLLKRPMFFYAYDLDNYKNNLRGFYFDFMKEVPGPITLTTQELVQSIQDYNSEEYLDKYQAFTAKFNSVDDGCASKNVVKIIKEKMEGR
jgi:CDP-glycerol glycerophosphotransferase